MGISLSHLVVCTVAGLVGIVICSLLGAAAERRERERHNLRPGAPLPADVSVRLWDRTAGPFAKTAGIVGVGSVVLTNGDLHALAALVGLVGGAMLRAFIAEPRSQ